MQNIYLKKRLSKIPCNIMLKIIVHMRYMLNHSHA